MTGRAGVPGARRNTSRQRAIARTGVRCPQPLQAAGPLRFKPQQRKDFVQETNDRTIKKQSRIRAGVRAIFKKYKYPIAAFFLPVLIMVMAFAATGIYPFGENQITVIDMYHQYVPFLSELQYKLHHMGSLFYSWDGAGGFNFWNTLAYYGASPLNLLLILFPGSFIVEGITVILLIKIGFAGCFMYLFLTHQYGKDAVIWLRSISAGAWIRVSFGALYALCAYTCAYYWCIMWLDVMALLPLIMLGLSRLVEEKKGGLYAISLGLACFCNYYISMMMCIFIVLYYLVLYVSKPREGGFGQFVISTIRTAAYSCLGAALAAPMLIPTYISMKNTYYTPAALPEEWIFHSQPLEVVNQLLPLAHLSFRSGLPNICAGLLTAMMLVCFFISRTIPFRAKVSHGLLLAVLFFSLNVNKLDFLWHGCHFPNELPFRWSFAVSFLLVTMACRAFMRLPQIRLNTIWAIFAGGLAWYLIVAKLLDGTEALDDRDAYVYIGIGFLALYTALMVVYRKGWLGAYSISLLLILVVSAELVCSVTMSFQKVGNVEREPYLEYSRQIDELTEQTKDEFARTELYYRSPVYIMNTPALYHYRGVSQFSSSLNADATELMEKIGVEGEPGKNRYNYVFSDPVTNAILNLKYIISLDEPVESEYFHEKSQAGDATLYENQYPLCAGYMLPESIRTWDMISTNPFTVLDDYVRAATDNQVTKVFRPLEDPELEAESATAQHEGNGIMSGYSDGGEEGLVRLNYTAEETGNHYAYIEAEQASTIDVIYEDGDILSLREDCGAIVDIGWLEEGETFSLEISYETDGGGSIRSHVCTMDEAAWEKAYGMISSNLMDVTGFGDTFLEGTVNVEKDGILTTSVLNEEGWHLKVDGEKKEITELIGGDFIGVPLDAGEHVVRLSFRPPGLIGGCILLVFAALLLAALRFAGGRIHIPGNRHKEYFLPERETPEPADD